MSGRLALLFPGQASQAVGMGVDLLAASPAARALFELVDQVTGLEISRWCAEGPIEQLTQTEVAQPAVLATSLAALAVLREQLKHGWQPAATAGHSVGELAAYVAAGVLEPAEAVRLVHARAQSMASACQQVDGSMAAVIGLDEDAVGAVCRQASDNGSSVELANLNAPGQLVISGARDALHRAAEHARAAGARRVLPLKVGGPFHSRYMRPAADHLEQVLAEMRFQPPQVPIVLNATGAVASTVDELRRELAVQVYSPVRWATTLRTLSALGCDQFLEVGPGEVLAGLVKRTLPEARVASFGSLAQLDAARALIGASSHDEGRGAS